MAHPHTRGHDDWRPESSTADAPLSVMIDWMPAKLAPPSNLWPAKIPQELLELAKQLELVAHQRQQLLSQSPSLSPQQRRPQSPATTILAPLPSPTNVSFRSPSKPITSPIRASLGLAPSLEISDCVVCDMCAAECASATLLRHHKSSSCPLRLVTCPRAGCGASFPAQDRATHDRDDCTATQRTQQLLDDHKHAHTHIPCDVCGLLAERRYLDGHKRFHCAQRLVACQFEAFGCATKFPLHQKDHHESTQCSVALRRARIRAEALLVNEQTTCDWCDQQVLKRKLLDHQEEECPKRERPCPNSSNGCTEWVPVELVDQHVRSQCVVTLERNAMAARAREMNESVVCNDCGAYVKRRYLARHSAGECVSRIVKCKNAAHGCKVRVRWRDRHLHEDFMALAMRERSLLQFPVGGRGYVVLNSETAAQFEKRSVDLSPPWTLELFLWVVDAQSEILDLHAQCVEYQEQIVVQSRDRARYKKQVSACKKTLKELKNLKKNRAKDKDQRSNSELLSDVSLQAKQLADTFNTAEQGVLESSRAIALAKGYIQILLTEACRILREEQSANVAAGEPIKRAVAAQTLELVATKELLGGEFLSDEEQARMSDVEVWCRAVQPRAAESGGGEGGGAERQQKAAEQRKLLGKRAEVTQLLAELPPSNSTDKDDEEEQGGGAEEETTRLRRRHERELAKIEAKLALISDNTPSELLDRKGRHVIASSSKNAIVLVGATHGQIAYFRSSVGGGGAAGGSRATPLQPRGEVNFQVSLPRDRWHHVAFCASAKQLTLVLNGEIKSVKKGVFELPFARLGSNDAQQQPGESFQGFLQELRIWKSCLSVDYLKAHATQIVDVQRNQGDLIGYYTFEEGMGDVVDDMALLQPRAPCFHTKWVAYNTPAMRRKFGLPPTPSLREKTSCIVNQRLKLLAQRARDRETEMVVCALNCGLQFVVRELETHQRLHCEHRLQACTEPGCELVYRFSDKQRHVASDCERATYRDELVKQYYDRESLVACLLNCGQLLKKRHTEKHYMTHCVNRLVTCPQRDCRESVAANALADHLENDCKSWELVAERKMVVNARQRQLEKLGQQTQAETH